MCTARNTVRPVEITRDVSGNGADWHDQPMTTTDHPAGSPTIAIVGSGPAGCYSAQFLRKRFAASEIVVFDRLAEPYGLVRYGVAPDHQGTKAITKQFDRLFEQGGVQFVGSTEIGTDISLEVMRENFDIVILATGLSADRHIEANSDELAGVFGAGALTRLINGHPDESADCLLLGENVTIIGHGNVALDLVRLFLTPAAELRALGVDEEAIAAVAPVRAIELVGRSAAPDAKFDVAMVKELGRLRDVLFRADDLASSGKEPDARSAAVTALVAESPAVASRVVQWRFGLTPLRITGPGRVTGITFTAGSEQIELLTDSVCTAIGFAEHEHAALRRGDHETPLSDLDRGFLDRGLYCVGWLRRGPTGTIPANRIDARMVVDEIIAAVEGESMVLGKPGRAGIASSTLIQELS